jgi:myo-inositol catabolism protein IolC
MAIAERLHRYKAPTSHRHGGGNPISAETIWRPTHTDPLLILAMDHRASFGKTLFDVTDDRPTPRQEEQIRSAKDLIYSALASVQADLQTGRAAVLVDERYGAAVIDRARQDGIVLAVPIEASGHDWFTLEWAEHWLEHVRAVEPDYAKVLVRDNPELDAGARAHQLKLLARVCAGLDGISVPLIYELLVPATDEQKRSVGDDSDRYDRDIRPELTVRVIAENQAAGIYPTLWKLEGLDTGDAARHVAAQARSGDRPADLILLGRDAPTERLDRWIDVATTVDEFVGFAIGRSIWEDVLRDYVSAEIDEKTAQVRMAERYLHFARRWTTDTSA